MFGKRADALEQSCWFCSEWISVANAPEHEGDSLRAADGTSWFFFNYTNKHPVKSARWMTTALGVYEIFVNGKRIGEEILKPGFTHFAKTKYSFTYDVTDALNRATGESNAFSAEVSAGWWRDKIVNFAGRKSAFRAVLELTYEDGSKELCGTGTSTWKAALGGPVTHAAIFDGEEYDARISIPCGLDAPALNTEYQGEILPTNGAEVYLREDLALKPVEAYCWKGVTGAGKDAAGETVHGTVIKTRTFAAGETLAIGEGETLIVDFGQNCSAVPEFLMSAPAGTVLTCLPGEMLNDANGESKRGNDGPSGSIYRISLRLADIAMRAIYTFSGNGDEAFMPRFTFFGYRYVSVTATQPVAIKSIRSIPVTSITKQMETGKLETGNKDINKLISNIYWGQISNYLSVPTDCPQRSERMGWSADTQVFAEAGSFNADTLAFLRKWLKDLRDSQHEDGSFPSVAPFSQYGNDGHRLGWADAGVIVPFILWKQFGDTSVITENFAAMERFLAMQDKDNYRTVIRSDGTPDRQYADWLSHEDYESCNGRAFDYDEDGTSHVKPNALKYWNYLAGCFWFGDARMMAQMAAAIGNSDAARKYSAMAEKAKAYIISEYIDKTDGLLLREFRHLQGAALFALKFGIIENSKALEETKAALRRNFADHGDCLQTGFLSTAILEDALSDNGMLDMAYTLLFQHKFPGWLFSVDQGATTIWESWKSYSMEFGFGPASKNSFNHYAYGAVLAWLWRTAAGIAADTSAPGFKNIIMAPKPDKRLGFVKAVYNSPNGIIKSCWHYEGDKCIWEFSIPENATASVTLPGQDFATSYKSGDYKLSF